MTHSNHQLTRTLPAFIWHFLKPYKLAVGICIALPILSGFGDPIYNILIKNVIDLLPQVQPGDLSPLVWPMSLIVLNFIFWG